MNDRFQPDRLNYIIICVWACPWSQTPPRQKKQKKNGPGLLWVLTRIRAPLKRNRNLSGEMIYSRGECGSAPAQLSYPGAPPESGRGGGDIRKERPKEKECKSKTEGPKDDNAQGRGAKPESKWSRSRKSGMKSKPDEGQRATGWGCGAREEQVHVPREQGSKLAHWPVFHCYLKKKILGAVRAKPAGQETGTANQMSYSCEASLPVVGTATPSKIRTVIPQPGRISVFSHLSTN